VHPLLLHVRSSFRARRRIAEAKIIYIYIYIYISVRARARPIIKTNAKIRLAKGNSADRSCTICFLITSRGHNYCGKLVYSLALAYTEYHKYMRARIDVKRISVRVNITRV
jgi:hypothetical protein